MKKLTCHRLLRRLTDCIFPPRCPVCDKITAASEGYIHPKCRRLLLPADSPVCMKCGRPLSDPRMEYCAICTRRMPQFDRGKALFLYTGPVKKTMYRFKYSNRREYAFFFAREAMLRYRQWLAREPIDCIIPVPMHRSKQRARGYNQAEVFARELSLRLDVPVRTDLIFRVHDTRPLKSFNADLRRRELQNAFQAAESGHVCRSVLLVDDIFTTGSTIDLITEELKKIGVEHVYVLTLCITPWTD